MNRLLAAAAAVMVSGCQGGLPDPGAPVPVGECHVEIANQMAVPISVTASGRTMRALGSIAPGAAVRYREDCEVGTVRIVAQIEESPPGIGPDGRPTAQTGAGYGQRTEVRVVEPRPGELVRVVFRGRRIRGF